MTPTEACGPPTLCPPALVLVGRSHPRPPHHPPTSPLPDLHICNRNCFWLGTCDTRWKMARHGPLGRLAARATISVDGACRCLRCEANACYPPFALTVCCRSPSRSRSPRILAIDAANGVCPMISRRQSRATLATSWSMPHDRSAQGFSTLFSPLLSFIDWTRSHHRSVSF